MDKKQIRQMDDFQKNVKFANTVDKRYNGKFVAVYKESVVGFDKDHEKLWLKIKKYKGKPELYVFYAHVI